MSLGVDTTVLVIGIPVVVAAVAVLVLVVTPWRGLRNEPPLDPDVETRLLLGEDPAELAADLDATETQQATVTDLDAEANADR